MALRGVSCAVGGEWVVRSAGVRRGCVGERKCSGRACRCAWASGGLRREWVVRSAGNASRSLRACVGAAWVIRSAREGRVAVRGRAKVFGGECVVRAAGLTHIRRSSTRARVLLYIRPPCPRREIAAMGPKDAPWEYPSPAKASAPAPSAFALPRPRSHFPRPRSHFRARVHTSPAWPSAAPTKTSASRSSSYPQWVIHGKVIHIVSPHLVQNVLASRLRTRIYNISFARRPLPGSVRAAPEKSPRRCDPVSRTAVRRVGEGKAKADAPSRSAEPCRLCAESLCAKAEVHKAIPAPARAFFPRQPAYRPPLPAYGRITVRKGGSAQGYPRPCPCVLPRGSLPTAPPPPPKWAPPPPQAGGKTTEWRTAAPQRPHTELSAETILAQFAYQDTKAHKALCTICNFRLHALQAFAQLFHSLAQIAPQRTEKSTNRRQNA